MKFLKSPAVLILVGAVAGIVFGLVVGEWAANLKFVGDIFIRLIQMSIVPLVASSVIVATGAMTGAGAGRLAGATFGWMLGFALVAAFVGWGLAELIQPGAGMRYDGELDPTLTDSAAATAVGWQQTVTGFVSTNVVEAMATGAMVPIIVFALIFGLALNRYTAMNGPTVVLTFFEQIQAIVLLMIRYVMFLAPSACSASSPTSPAASGSRWSPPRSPTWARPWPAW